MSQARIAARQILRRKTTKTTTTIQKSLPLTKLPQNSRLNINALALTTAPVPVNVRLIPEWRDDGHISLLHQQHTTVAKKSDQDDNYDDHTSNTNTNTNTNTCSVDWTVKVQDDEYKTGLTTVDVDINAAIQKLEEDHSSSSSSSSSSLDDEEETTTVTSHTEELDDLDDHDSKTPNNIITLTAHIPEKCNVTCKLHHGGNIDIDSKLEGEHGFELMTSGGNITVSKLRGDSIKLDTKFKQEMGDGRVGGRGWGGIIHAKKSLEAQELDVTVGKGGRFRAKMLNVSNANIECEDGGRRKFADPDSDPDKDAIQKLDDDDTGALIDVSSIYTSMSGEGAHMVVKNVLETDDGNRGMVDDSLRKVRVKSNHGHISVSASSSFKPQPSSLITDEYDQNIAHVELGGVNGSFDVSIHKLGRSGVLGSSEEPAAACEDGKVSRPVAAKVHIDSLSPGQASILTSDFGNVDISLDRKIESDIRILSAPLMNNLDPAVLLMEDEEELVEILVEHSNDIEELVSSPNSNMERGDEGAMSSSVEATRIHLETEAFSGYRNCDMDHIEYVHGSVENKSEEPNSRFDVKTKGLASSSVGKIRIDGAAGQALHGFSGGTVPDAKEDGDETKNQGIIDMPLLAIATDGVVKVESLSWFGAIARRYGVEDENRGVGRQASKSLPKQ